MYRSVREWEPSYSSVGAGPRKFTDSGALLLAHGNVGEIQYELIEPIEGKPSLWADFLAENGEGLHHISHNVADVDAAAAELVADGGRICEFDLKTRSLSPSGWPMWKSEDPAALF